MPTIEEEEGSENQSKEEKSKTKPLHAEMSKYYKVLESRYFI
jgi:hypothetical protein